mmetsp:Transcript_23195/g.59615  ORF Transcript_23195/g.59615 Transcript_23195/m.59615 type:complete len:401 (+) Transcript_23195:292-1494(+)
MVSCSFNTYPELDDDGRARRGQQPRRPSGARPVHAAPVLRMGRSSRHVRRDVDRVGERRDGHLEARLHVLEHLGVILRRRERDREPLSAEAPRAPDSVQIAVRRLGHVVVDDDVDALDVDTAPPDVRRDEDAVLEVLESLVLLNSLLLRHRAVDGDRGEVALGEELVELDGALDRLDEDHHLVELERIKQVVELAVLLLLAQLDVVLLKPVQRQLAVVHVDLHRILHELLAHGAHLSRERSREHHHLLLVRRELEDVLHVLAHVELLEHLVALIEDEVLDLAEVEVLVARKRQHAPRRADEDVRRVRLEDLLVLGDGHATVEDARLDVGQVPGEPHKLVVDLEGQLARVAHHDHRRLCLFGLELVQHGQHKHGRLAHARLGLADHVHAQDGLRNALVLHL